MIYTIFSAAKIKLQPPKFVQKPDVLSLQSTED